MVKYFLGLLFSMLLLTNSYVYHLKVLKQQLNDEIKSLDHDLNVLKKEWDDLNKVKKLKEIHEKLKNQKEYNSKKVYNHLEESKKKDDSKK